MGPVSLIQKFAFPISPPSSGSPSALSSPRLSQPALLPATPPPPLFKRSTSTHHLWPGSATDSDTERTSHRHPSKKRLSRKKSSRALPLPPLVPGNSTLTLNPQKRSRPLSCASDVSASSSSSSLTQNEHAIQGIGRKVAASLQLFKETATEDAPPDHVSVAPAISRSASNLDQAAQPQFEFVKRSEWPDRESAAVRREKSSTAQERVRLRSRDPAGQGPDSPSPFSTVIDDLTLWRNERRMAYGSDGASGGIDRARGRTRERLPDDLLLDKPLPSNDTFPDTHRSLVYPPSPSPSRSPINRDLVSSRPLPSPLPSTPVSPWSTDDESESASATSASSLPQSPIVAHPSLADDDDALVSFHQQHAQDPGFGSDSGLSPEHLPHIPLKPFRNQVGGHSAIYKFTKRAVCKPLVSRENLFYESVEREAPPLLDFIPRYLGVMLVSYRRVPKGSSLSSSLERCLGPSRPPIHKALTSPSTTARLPPPSDLRVDEGEATECEFPEVMLDKNRHIIPEWMFRGCRPAGVQSTISSPDLGRQQSSPPKVDPTDTLLTPVNSPAKSARALPAIEMPAGREFLAPKSVSDEEHDRETRIHPYQATAAGGGFGGTGSTVVNTKLKDHVFSAVLRRYRRRTGSRWTEDEGNVADTEGDDGPSGPLMPKRSKKLHRQVERLKMDAGAEQGTGGIRRVRSEAMIASPGKLEALVREERRSKELLSVFGLGYEKEMDKGKRKMQATSLASPSSPSLDLSPFKTRKRSRSRSLSSFPRSSPAPAERESLPEKALAAHAPESDPTVTRQNHFILMEDLTGKLKHPCVMDLKMGTRQYGMDATAAKKKSQRKKCDRTTSRTLGVRLCGKQVWNHVTQSYVTEDKYMGRDVQTDEFAQVVASFLYDGSRLLAYHIPVLLQKLYALARIINRLKGYRFYGCSLLLIYDGDNETQQTFRSHVKEYPSSRRKRGESLGRNVARSGANKESKDDRSALRRSHSEDLLIGSVSNRSSGKRKRGAVDVRIVDFAHTTTSTGWLPYPEGRRGPTEHTSNSGSKGYEADVDPETGLIYARFPPHFPDQPDRGFLFGLYNLAETLEQIWNSERLRRIKATRDDPSISAFELPPLSVEGKEIFEEIFGDGEDPGMIST